MLDGKAATPLYVQLIQELEAKISEGILTPEARLPSESELSKQYGVSIITVRKAVGSLAEKGLVEKKAREGNLCHQKEIYTGYEKPSELYRAVRQIWGKGWRKNAGKQDCNAR
mgnify:CR=1 FL=1